MSTQTATPADAGAELLDLYDIAMPQIYGYFHRRCRHRATAEDLTTEVFVAAVESIGRDAVEQVTVAWLVGIARHKLVDHWRRLEREQRRLDAVGREPGPVPTEDDWNIRLDALDGSRRARRPR